MKPPHRAVIAALVAAVPALWPDAARAGDRACPGMSVEGDADLRDHWPGLLERIQGEFRARPDVDPCARVALRLEDGALIHVSVTLPDGRAASRRVTQQDDVVPTLQALLLLPERPAPAPAPKPRSHALPPRRHSQLTTRPSIDRAEAKPTEPARELGIELSVITGARIGDGQFGAGVGVLSFLDLSGWLFGFEGRIDSYGPLEGGDPDTALELAVLAGRRFDLGGVALDLTAGPAVAMRRFAASETEVARVDTTMPMPPTPPPPQQAEPGPVPRLLLGARLGFSPRSVFRTFLGVDGEIGPAQGTAANANTNSGSLPRFCIGLALGATVGTP